MASNKNDKGMNPLAAGAIGAAIGAAVGVAAVELADKGNREKLQDKLEELEEKGEQVYAGLKETATNVKDKVEGVKKD
ncbi:MAG: hypothetical protein NUV73_01490 [Candidatus Daviesbacteria bacterium]|nr:hypothetical protein [Candidatus Daviesbacteria bacterium]